MSILRKAGPCAWLRCAIVIAALVFPAMAQNTSGVATLQNSIQTSIAQLDRSLVAVVAVGNAGPMIVGTGFFVAKDGTFVTALHVLQQGHGIAMRAMLRGDERQLFALETLAVDAARDLAICRIVATAKTSPVPVSLAQHTEVAPGTLVVVSGFPLAAKSPSSHLGIISSASPAEESLEVGALVNEGESGAPIVRVDNGEVIGMVSAVRTASTYAGSARGVEDQNSGITLGSRAEWVRELMARAATKSE